MRRLEALDEGAVRAAVERDAEGDELADAGGSLVDEHAHRVGIAEAGPRGQGVADVVCGAVVVEHHAGDAALGVARVGVLEHVLGHQRDAAAVLDGVEGDGQPGDAAADDDGVHRTRVRPKSSCHDACSHAAAGAAGGLAASIRSRARRAGSATSCGTVMRLSTSPSTSPSSTHAR